MDFDDDQLARYARQIVLPEIGGEGQSRLLRGSVLIIGAGGLGAPLLLYLAATGTGRIGIVDDDHVERSNLHRQIMFRTGDEGRRKVDVAVEQAQRLNPGIEVEPFNVHLDAANVDEMVARFDVVADGSDNFETRALVHEACLRLRRPLVSASVQGMDGQLTTFRAFDGPPHPCLRCLYATSPMAGALPTCAQGGVLGPAVGVMGSLQAVEVVKELIGLGPGLSGQLLVYDARSCDFIRLRYRRDPGCSLCGARRGEEGC